MADAETEQEELPPTDSNTGEVDPNTRNYLENLVQHTGTHYFNTYSDLELRKMNIPTTDLIMAKRNLYLRKRFWHHAC